MIGIPNEAEVRPDGSDPVTLCDLALEAIVGLVRREKAPMLPVPVEGGDGNIARCSALWSTCETEARGVEGRLLLKESERVIVAKGR